MIYLDHNATTPLDERVLEAMLPYLTRHHGNPSSTHQAGRTAREAVSRAREQVAALVNARPEQVIFTSGGTEANHLALLGALQGQPPARVSISAVEHASVRGAAELLAGLGWQVDSIPVDEQCRVVAERLELHPGTRLVSVMWANNETGALQDIRAIAKQVRGHGALFHTDATQAAGKVAVDFAASGTHLMTLTAHKLYGPKGVGALLAERASLLKPLLRGGGQEKGLRAGTENVAGIVGFGAATEFARMELNERAARWRALRERLESGLRALEVTIYSAHAERLPNTVQFSVPQFAGETLLEKLDQSGFTLSSGSACSSGKVAPSHVLLAMGVPRERMRNVLRVSLGLGNSEADIATFVGALTELTGAQRAWPEQSVA